jgi:DNA-binding CsgD family transcriptional regulator
VAERGLLERTAEMESLRGALQAAAAGRGSVSVIEGPAGIGKTALLEACRGGAAEAGVNVLSARAGELEGDLAWNLVRQLFADVILAHPRERDALLSGAAGLAAPALGLAQGGDIGALHGLYWLTATLAQARPLLLAVDDAHWGDPSSLEYLAYLAARAADLAVAVVVTTRVDERRPSALAALLASRELRRLVPGTLSETGTAAFVRGWLGGDAAPAFCTACHAATGGNPFLLHELVSQLARDRVEPSAARAADVASITPDTVTRTVVARLARLPREVRDLAAAVAILGDDARLAEAARLANVEAAEAARAADTLAEAGILEAGPSLRFVHPLIRAVIYDSLPAHERAHRHGQAARVLGSAGFPAELVAAQLLACEPSGDAWVVGRLRDAAEDAMRRGAPETAADLLGRALREPPPQDDRFELLVMLGRAEIATGRPDAVEHLHRAVQIASTPHDRALAALDLGRSLFVAGELPRAAEVVERGLDELRAADVEDASLIALMQAAWLSIARTVLPLRARATELARGISDRPPSAVASYGERAMLAQVAGQLAFDGVSRERSLPLARMAVGDGALIEQETAEGTAWPAAAGALGWGDDFDAFDALHHHAMEDARRRGSVIGFASASYGLSFSHYYRGMLSAAIADAEQAIAAEADGWRHFLPAARAQLAWALIERNELAAASAALERARSDLGWSESSMQALVLEAEARIHLARGEPEHALEAALRAGRVAVEALMPNPSTSPWRSRAGLAAARLGRHDQAQELLDEELALARSYGAPRPIGVALMHAGLARGARGVEELEEAVAVLAGSPATLEHARALVYLGAALRRARRPSAAREVLQEGLEASVACEALALEEYARGELAAAGGRPVRRRRRAAEGLTPSERRVAELAASGMSNREIAQALFVSLRTVETHLTRTYRKLGIDRRPQLGDALARGDAPAGSS